LFFVQQKISKRDPWKTEFFAYVISRKRNENQQKQSRNDALHVKTSQSAKKLASLQAGSCWNTSMHGVAKSAKLSGKAMRRESEPALISANFLFPARKQHKRISQLIFTGFLGKIVNLFHNNM